MVNVREVETDYTKMADVDQIQEQRDGVLEGPNNDLPIGMGISTQKVVLIFETKLLLKWSLWKWKGIMRNH